MKSIQKIILVSFLILSFHEVAFAQTDSINFFLLKNQDFINPKLESKKVVKYGITSNKTFLQRINPVNNLFSGLMFIYQKMLSQQISADCLYSPTCSEYTRQLFVRYGLIKGFVFSADRLMRCDRISATTIHQISIDRTDGKIHETTDRYNLHNTHL